MRHVLSMRLAAGLAALVFAGCGEDDKAPPASSPADDETAITGVLTQLQNASVAGDGEKICVDIFTEKLAETVAKSAESGSCEQEVEANLFSPKTRIEVQNVDVTDAANASATIKEANGNVSTVFFAKQDGSWRIRSVQPA